MSEASDREFLKWWTPRWGHLDPTEEFYKADKKKAFEAGWEAATFEASTRAGDVSNEAEKVQRCETAIAELDDFVGGAFFKHIHIAQIRAIIQKAQG